MINIDKLLELEAKATPGPWLFDWLGDGLTDRNYKPLFDGYIGHDGALVHAMRNNIKPLLEELKAARKVVEAARKHWECYNSDCPHEELRKSEKDVEEAFKELEGGNK